MIQRGQAHWESATPKYLIDRDNSGCCPDDKGRGHKLSSMWVLFPVRTSLCSSPCTCCILVVPVTSSVWTGSQYPLLCTHHGYHDTANSALSLIFEALYFGADICDLFLFNSEVAILGFTLCHPRVNQMSLLTFSKTSVCYQLGELIKSLYIHELTGMLKDKICLLSLSSVLTGQQSRS